MTAREQLLQQVLALPAADQAFLAQSLVDHLITHAVPESEESAGVAGDELLLELRRRSAAYQSGQTTSQVVADVLNELRQRQASESPN